MCLLCPNRLCGRAERVLWTVGTLSAELCETAFWEEQGYGHHCTVVPVTCVPSRIACSMAWFGSISFASGGPVTPAAVLRMPALQYLQTFRCRTASCGLSCSCPQLLDGETCAKRSKGVWTAGCMQQDMDIFLLSIIFRAKTLPSRVRRKLFPV